MESLRIRLADVEDADLLAELGGRTFLEAFEEANTPDDIGAYLEASFSPARMEEEIADPGSTFLLAFADNSVAVGYAKLRASGADPAVRGPKPVELERIYVSRRALATGVGAALMQAALDQASAAGWETLWLGVWEENPRAIAFYQKWDFEVVGSHVFQLGSAAQNDLIMERPVSEQAAT